MNSIEPESTVGKKLWPRNRPRPRLKNAKPKKKAMDSSAVPTRFPGPRLTRSEGLKTPLEPFLKSP